MMPEGYAMSETRKIAAILVSDVVGYSRLAGADEDRTLARLRSRRERRPYVRLIWCRDDQVVRSGSDLGYRNTRWSSTHARLNLTLDPSLPM
jgi:hypothetical protein